MVNMAASEPPAGGVRLVLLRLVDTPVGTPFTVNEMGELKPLKDMALTSGVETDFTGVVMDETDVVSLKSTIVTVRGILLRMDPLIPVTVRV